MNCRFSVVFDSASLTKKMDHENQKRIRELTNARVKKHRKRMRSEAEQLNSMMQDEPNDEIKKKEILEKKIQRRKELVRERSRRYRERKRLRALKSVDHVTHDSQILGPSHGIPPLVIRNQRTTVHDSQIAGTSTNMDIPLVIRDESENVNRFAEYRTGLSRGENFVTQENQVNFLLPRNEENQPINNDDKLAPLEDQACKLPTPNVQFNRLTAAYSTYTRHSSAHIQFHKQFTQNEFGYACKICD